MLDRVVNRASLRFIYELAVHCEWTSEWLPRRNLSTTTRFSSAFYKHSNTSLQQNQHVCMCSGSGSDKNKPLVYHLFVCACRGHWIFVTMDRLPDSRDIEESVEKKNCISTFQGAKISLKDAFSFMHLNNSSSFFLDTVHSN